MVSGAGFCIKAGDLNFESYVYDWLVVAGDKAKFKGDGTINDAGMYGFMISAIDGEKKVTVDKFRIKIWDKGTELVIYDNQLLADDNADPTTEISAGAIAVHDGKDSIGRIAHGMTNEELNLDEISIYPNPEREIVTIEFPSDYIINEESIELHLFNLTGVDMMNNNMKNVKNNRLD